VSIEAENLDFQEEVVEVAAEDSVEEAEEAAEDSEEEVEEVDLVAEDSVEEAEEEVDLEADVEVINPMRIISQLQNR